MKCFAVAGTIFQECESLEGALNSLLSLQAISASRAIRVWSGLNKWDRGAFVFESIMFEQFDNGSFIGITTVNPNEVW